MGILYPIEDTLTINVIESLFTLNLRSFVNCRRPRNQYRIAGDYKCGT
jgi:hypothetical protein